MKKLILLLALFGVIGFGWLFKVVNLSQSGSEDLVVIEIEKGEGVSSILTKLQDLELIDSSFIFKKFISHEGFDTKIKPGAYELSQSMSMRTIAETITSGISYNERNITLLEGWNLRQVADYLIQEGFISTPEELYLYTGYPAQVYHGTNDDLHDEYDFLEVVPSGYSLEGFIFPDTYRVFANSDVDDILRRILDNFEVKFTQQIKDDLLASDMDFYEVLKVASVVVKEAKTYEDKRKVAGVFLNRLKIGMGLQSDPTVNYVTLKVTDNPSLEDISTESAYNTYKYSGLPPTPISNPGLEDILAVLHPIEHDYYFFLNTKQGEMIFSKDFEEHKANRVKYGQ